MRRTEITPAEVTTRVCGVTGGSKNGKLTPDAASEWRKTDSPNFFQINDHKSGNENVSQTNQKQRVATKVRYFGCHLFGHRLNCFTASLF